MAYSHTTYAQAKTQLAQLLNDTGKVFWVDAELGGYVIEALRTYGALTNRWRDRGVFNTAAGTAFYDLNTYVSTLLTNSITDASLVTTMEYHLLEPATNPWSGTDQFNLTDVLNALQRRRNQFLMDTGTVLTRSTQIVGVNPIGRVALSDSIIDVRRAAWQPQTGPWQQLWREDEYALAVGSPGWANDSGIPAYYSVAGTPPLTVQLAPPPADVGTLDLVTVNSGAALTGAGVALGVPDDWAWVVKWGTLADLLGMDGQARDPDRAAYCESRYKQGVELAGARYIVAAEIQGVPLVVDTLANLDAAVQGWQGQTQALPETLATAANLMAMNPVPDGIYSVTVDVVRNAPVPSLDADFIQVGREELDAILGYAQHLAAFKMGGAEFKATQTQLDRFLIVAAMSNARLRANLKKADLFIATSDIEESKRPRAVKGAR